MCSHSAIKPPNPEALRTRAVRHASHNIGYRQDLRKNIHVLQLLDSTELQSICVAYQLQVDLGFLPYPIEHHRKLILDYLSNCQADDDAYTHDVRTRMAELDIDLLSSSPPPRPARAPLSSAASSSAHLPDPSDTSLALLPHIPTALCHLNRSLRRFAKDVTVFAPSLMILNNATTPE